MTKHFNLSLLLLTVSCFLFGQQIPEKLSSNQFDVHQQIQLAEREGWVFKQGSNTSWASIDLNTTDWENLNPSKLSAKMADNNGRIEGWFRILIQIDSTLAEMPLGLSRQLWAATDTYVDGNLVHSFGNTGNPYEAYNPTLKYPIPLKLLPGKNHLLAIHFVDYETTFTQREIRLKPANLINFINITGSDYIRRITHEHKQTHIYGTLCIGISFLLFFLFWLLAFLNPKQKIFQLIGWMTSAVLITSITIFFNTFFEISYSLEKLRFVLMVTFQAISVLFSLLVLEWAVSKQISMWSKIIIPLILITNLLAHLFSISLPFGIVFISMLGYYGSLLIKNRKTLTGTQWAVVAAVVVPILAAIIIITIHKYSLNLFYEYEKPIMSLSILSGPLFLLGYISVRVRETLQEVYAEAQKVLKVTEEKKEILENQNIILEKQVNERTTELKNSLEHLKSTQSQLIQSEKMASLGELTAGIAHEIQNPLNFVNNFSEVSNELIDEMNEELNKGDIGEAKAIASDIKQNLEKINHHGKRADAIVKGMLQHSRNSGGVKEPTDINALADEYLRLAYHGLRAKDTTFNATLNTDFDESIGKIKVVPQDIGRVILNLITNAFYVVNEKKGLIDLDLSVVNNYNPTVTVSTKKEGNKVFISVKDNGNGIPPEIKDKIFQPFFTTKPTGSGTGLGLSLSYDIVKAHGGEIRVLTKKNEGLPTIASVQVGTEFIIQLPI